MERVPSHAWTKIFLLCEPHTVEWFASCFGLSVAGTVAAHFARTVRAYSDALDKLPTDAWLFALFSDKWPYKGPEGPGPGPSGRPLPNEFSARTIVASLYPEHLGACGGEAPFVGLEQRGLVPCPYETHDAAINAAARYQLALFAYKWRVRDLRDIAAYRPTGPSTPTYDPGCPSFRARIVRSPFSLPPKYDAHLADSAARALGTMRAHDPTLSAVHRAFLDGTARYTRLPENAIRYILCKRELKPNYARQFGPVEVWDVRDVPFRYHHAAGAGGGLTLHGRAFPCGAHDTRLWYVRHG